MGEGTSYLIFEAYDEPGVTWKRIGEQEAGSSDQALRLFFADPPIEREAKLHVAVSSRSFQPRPVGTKVQISLGEPLDLGEATPASEEPDDQPPVAEEDAVL